MFRFGPLSWCPLCLMFNLGHLSHVHCYSYGQHPKTGPSGIQMVIFEMLIESGFQMALAAILFLPFKNRTKKSGFQMVGHLFTI